jgi:hypothetical protein
MTEQELYKLVESIVREELALRGTNDWGTARRPFSTILVVFT